MKLKDNEYFKNVYEAIGKSVKRVNEKIVVYQKDGCTVEQLQVLVAMEQLSMQHEILTTLAMMIWEPQTAGETLPPPPQKIVGFK